MKHESALKQLIDAGIHRVTPSKALEAHLPAKPTGRCVVIGAGKASALMAKIVDEVWTDVPLSGVVSTRYGHAVDAGRIRVIEAGHPVPDSNSELAAVNMLEQISSLSANDVVISLMSGGGSACCALPIEGISLELKAQVNKRLLNSGAPIEHINILRRAMSRVKGGKLAAAAFPARVHTLVISDIPGDRLSDVASGPTIPVTDKGDLSPIEVALRYGCDDVIPLLSEAQVPAITLNKNSATLVASPMQALEAVASKAVQLGYKPLILGDTLQGESKDLGKIIASIVNTSLQYGHPVKGPAAIISGGETTVTVKGSAGRGGRNTEFLLSLFNELKMGKSVYACAVDSDGIDGTEDAAGAFFTPDSFIKAKRLALVPQVYLDKHDSYSFFEHLDNLVVTGPTLTNVNDIRIILLT